MHKPFDETIENFLDRTFRISKSYATKRSYRIALRKFVEFLRVQYMNTLDELIADLIKEKQNPIVVLDDYYTYLSNNNKSNATIRSYLSIAKEFLNSQGFHIYNEDIKQKFRLPKTQLVYEEGLTKETLVRLLHNSPNKLQVAILICCSSGMRVGELVQLKISDVNFETTPTSLKIRKETTKTRETRITCISSEATRALKDYLTRTFDWNAKSEFDKPIFMTSEDEVINPQYFKSVLSGKAVLTNMLLRVLKSVPELDVKNENGRNNIHFHAFRAWFKTQVTSASQSDFAEALMGHKSLKLVYFRQNNLERLKTYKKVEPSLTISDFTKVEESMDEMQSKIESLTLELEKVKQWRGIATKYQNT